MRQLRLYITYCKEYSCRITNNLYDNWRVIFVLQCRQKLVFFKMLFINCFCEKLMCEQITTKRATSLRIHTTHVTYFGNCPIKSNIYSYCVVCLSCTRNSDKSTHNKLSRKVWGNDMKSYQCKFSLKTSHHYNSICGNPFLVRKIRGIGPILCEECSSQGIFLVRFQTKSSHIYFFTRNHILNRNIPRNEKYCKVFI